MRNLGRRHNRRHKLAISAVVSDCYQQNAVRCMLQDGSISGCNIISRHVPDLPDKVLIKVPQLSQSIKGHIIWRNQNSAGVELKWETNYPDERRNTARQEVAIPATIKDHSFNKLADCIICDASMIGCRISSEELSTLPDDFYIDTPGLTKPVQALIVWRKDHLAGLEFVWESDVYILDDALAM